MDATPITPQAELKFKPELLPTFMEVCLNDYLDTVRRIEAAGGKVLIVDVLKKCGRYRLTVARPFSQN